MAGLPVSDLVVGLGLVTVPLLITVVYTVCVKAMLSNKDLMKNSCYVFMVQLGVADIIQLLGFTVGGVMTLAQSTGPAWLNYTAGALMELGWYTTVTFVHLLAFNRFIAMGATQYVDVLFGKRGQKIFSLIPWLVGLTMFLWMVVEKAFVYDLWSFSWYYDYTLSLDTLKLVDSVVTNSQIIMCVLWYALLFVTIKILRGNTSQGAQQSNAANQRAAWLSAVLICGVLIMTDVVFLYISPLLPNSRYSYLGLTATWTLNSGINPFIYLTLHKTLRTRVKDMVSRNATTVQPISQQAASSRRRF